MSSLEELIRAAAARGELTYLSVVPVAGKGPNNIGWSASFSPGATWGTGYGLAADPVEALKLAMLDKGLGRLPGKLEKTIVTAEKPKGKKPDPVDDSDFLGG
jgi:hypothetical protein